MMTVSEMKERKKTLHYTNEKIAELSGVPLGTVQKIFGGATTYPRYDTMQALEKALGGSGSTFTVQKTPAVYGSSTKEDLPRQGEYTVDDYRALPDHPRYELIDGVLIEMDSPSTKHQSLLGELAYHFNLFIRSRKGTCRVFFAPFDVQLDCDEKTMVQPDLIIICDRDKLKDWGLWGAPDFALEVLSPSSKKKDMIIKYRKYKAAGVKEYWLVDPENEIVLTYYFGEDGTEKTGIYGFDNKIPVEIYHGELEIDFAEIMPYL